jgi:hypothetical protein
MTEVYGTVAGYAPGVIPTDHVDQIHGLRVGRSPDGRPVGIELQFDTETERRHMTIPLMQALALLSFLKSFQLEEDLPFPEDPRDPNWRAADYKSNR